MYKMFVLDLDPVVLELGFLEIRWYSLIFALGFVLFYLLLGQAAKRRLVDGLTRKNYDLFVIYSIIGVVAGARLFYFLFYDISQLFTDPLEFFMIWHAGLSFHGGLIGFIISASLFSKKSKVSFWKLMDISAIAAIFGLMLGRIGNLLNGELAGTVFDGPWCAVFPLYDSLCRHPYPLYAFLSHLLLFVYLVILLYANKDRLKEFFGKRVIAANFLVGYGILRIITDIWKVDDVFLFLKTGQWLSVFMVIVGFLLLVNRKK